MRPQGWELRLASAIAAAECRAWAWGAHDCASFARACAVAVLDGATLWDAIWPTYATEIGARRALAKGGGLVAMLDAVGPRVEVPFARRGDLACVRGIDGEPHPDGDVAVGVIDGARILIAAPGGLARWRLSAAFAAWPVG
jgi:hypothetical protein